MTLQDLVAREYNKKKSSWFDIHKQFDAEHLQKLLETKNITKSDISPEAKLFEFYSYTNNIINNVLWQEIHNNLLSVNLSRPYDILVGSDASIYEYYKFVNVVLQSLDIQFLMMIGFETTGVPHDGAVYNRSPVRLNDFRVEYFL